MKFRLVKVLMMSSLLVAAHAAVSLAYECIAPANPGGGWDFTCRQVSKVMYDIGAIDKPIQVTNMAGAGGGIAYNYVVAERNKDADLIVAASMATTTRLAQNAYAGMTADQVRFVGALGADPGIIMVGAKSPFKTLKDFVDAAKKDPQSISIAGGSIAGGFDHIKPLMVLQRGGVEDVTKVRYVAFNGGGEAITQTIGGFTQAMSGDMSEAVGFIKSGDVRVLAVLTDERVPGFDDIPTAKEQGFDVVAVNWRGLYVPKGISDETFQQWADRLQKVADSDEWKKVMADNGLAPFTKVGADFQNYIDGVTAEVKKISKQLGVIQ
jgi:putative tricarboxylic transport membrane protein